MKRIVYFCVVLMLIQCKSSTSKSEVRNLVEIDFSQKYPEKELYIQDIAKVEYIPLETNWNTIMKSDTRIDYVSDNYIVASNTFDGDVFVFDGKGKSKFHFNNKGRSETKYNQISSIAFDEYAKEIFIADRFATHPKFLVYAEDGEFKRTLECSPIFQPQIYNFDNATLLAYDENRYSSKPYLFISKKDGSIVDSLDFHLPIRLSNSFQTEVEFDGQKYTANLYLRISNNRSYGKNFLIGDLYSDTIYRLIPLKELQPVIVQKSSVQNTDPKIVIANRLITGKYIFLEKAVLDFEIATAKKYFPITDLMYDFETGQLNEYKLINKDFESSNVSFYETITPENTGIYILNVAELYKADEAGKIIKGNLRQLLITLDEWDNPIMVKIKF